MGGSFVIGVIDGYDVGGVVGTSIAYIIWDCVGSIKNILQYRRAMVESRQSV
jgi:hypothetical protein